MNDQTFAAKNAAIISALKDGEPYVYFKADDDYYSLIGVVIDSQMERMPAPLGLELLAGDPNAGADDSDVTYPSVLGRGPVLTIDRNSDAHAGDKLMEDLCRTLDKAEGKAWINEQGKLVIHTVVSRDPSRRNNGGEYDFYRTYQVTPVGVLAEEEWSCDIQPYDGGADVYMTAVENLGPLLAQAQEIVKAAQRANRTPYNAQEQHSLPVSFSSTYENREDSFRIHFGDTYITMLAQELEINDPYSLRADSLYFALPDHVWKITNMHDCIYITEK